MEMNETTAMEESSPSSNGGYMSLFSYMQMFFYVLIGIIGLLGNALVIYVVARFTPMKTITNRYLMNLAFADTCLLLGIPFLVTTMAMRQWLFGNTMCKIYMGMTGLSQNASSLFLLVISTDRYIAVCHSNSASKYRTETISILVSWFTWICSISLSIPVMVLSTETYINPACHNATNTDNLNCTVACVIEEVYNFEYTVFTFVVSFAVPLILILSFYTLIINRLRTVGPQNKSKEKKRAHRKVTRMVLTVITVYFICISPYWILQLLLVVDESDTVVSAILIHMHTFAYILFYSNSAVNPILYAFLSDNFQKSFMKACACAADDANVGIRMETSVFPKKKLSAIENDFDNTSVTMATRLSVPNCDGEADAILLRNTASNKHIAISDSSNTLISTNL